MDIYFTDSLPVSGKGVYIDYYNKDYNCDGWERIDVAPTLSSQQEQYFSSIEKWHTDLCVIGTHRLKWWWLLPASRLILWHPPIWKPLVFALAVIKELEAFTGQDVYLVGCPAEVGEYLKEFSPKLQIHNEFKIKNTFLHTLKNLILSFKYVFEVLIYILSHKKRRQGIGEDSPVIVWSYELNGNAGQAHVKDHFYGDMFNADVFEHPVHRIFYDSPRNASKTSFSKNSSRGRSFIYDWIGVSEWWSLVKFCFSEWVSRRATRLAPTFVMNGFSSNQFAGNFTSELIIGHVPYIEFTALLGMKNVLKELSPRALIYPYEEKCIERALLMAVEGSMSSTVTIGFAHAVYNNGLMYLRRRSKAKANPPSPDKLLVTGPALKRWLVDWAGWDGRDLVVTGSPRYQRMIESVSNEALENRLLRILILIGQGYEATILSNQVQNNPKVFDKCEVTIRPYPYSWQKEQDEAYARIKKISKDVQVMGGTLAEQLSWCDIAVYCSTTAGLEAMLSGRLTVYLDMNHIFSLNPIDEKIQDAALIRLQDLSELQLILDHVSSMTKDCYADAVRCQNRIAGQIFQKVDHDRLNRFFQCD